MANKISHAIFRKSMNTLPADQYYHRYLAINMPIPKTMPIMTKFRMSSMIATNKAEINLTIYKYFE